MKLIQLTDIHLTTLGNTIGGRDPNANFERALSHALARHGDAEAIVITGDLSDWGDREDYERLRARIGRSPIPVHLCIGNHDDRETFLGVFPHLCDENGFVQQVIPLSRGTAVLLDSWGPETHAGHFCETRAAWLDAQLTALEGPVWIFIHHNPAPTHIGPKDKIMLLDEGRLGRVVGAHRGKIGHLFHGHCHIPLAGSFHGVPTSAPRGTNHASWTSFEEKNLLSCSNLPESYGVIIADLNSVTVHMVEFGYDGPIHSKASPDYASWDRAEMAR
ncbi:MAG: metallophosphoesterase [Pseudomonadota bacterium]